MNIINWEPRREPEERGVFADVQPFSKVLEGVLFFIVGGEYEIARLDTVPE